jgi:hypothetical protein
MKEQLKDLIHHTHSLGCIDLIKVTSTQAETKVEAMSEDRAVIITGTFATPVPEFAAVSPVEHTFGMPNLDKLKTIISFDNYDDSAQISVTTTQRDSVDTPTTIKFISGTGDFVNDYRLMSKAIVEEKVKSVKFNQPPWSVEFEPTVVGISNLKRQAQANSEETVFTIKTENNAIKCFFGDPSTHSGNFVFAQGVPGTMTRQLAFPVKVVLAILDLVGDKKIRISDQGVAEIKVNSGSAVYTYLLPAQSK